jgi:hypothetical protein
MKPPSPTKARFFPSKFSRTGAISNPILMSYLSSSSSFALTPGERINITAITTPTKTMVVPKIVSRCLRVMDFPLSFPLR